MHFSGYVSNNIRRVDTGRIEVHRFVSSNGRKTSKPHLQKYTFSSHFFKELFAFQKNLLWQSDGPVSFQGWRNLHFLGEFPISYQIYSKAKNAKMVYIIDIPLNCTKLNAKLEGNIFPEVFTKTNVCTAMLLYNLAEPEWVNVGCDEPSSNHVLCAFGTENELRKGVDPSHNNGLRIYNKECVVKWGMCLMFLWVSNKEEMTKSFKNTSQ